MRRTENESNQGGESTRRALAWIGVERIIPTAIRLGTATRGRKGKEEEKKENEKEVEASKRTWSSYKGRNS